MMMNNICIIMIYYRHVGWSSEEEHQQHASGEIAGFKVVTVQLTYLMKLCNDVELA